MTDPYQSYSHRSNIYLQRLTRTLRSTTQTCCQSVSRFQPCGVLVSVTRCLTFVYSPRVLESHLPRRWLHRIVSPRVRRCQTSLPWCHREERLAVLAVDFDCDVRCFYAFDTPQPSMTLEFNNSLDNFSNPTGELKLCCMESMVP